jgi:hypothetical protein
MAGHWSQFNLPDTSTGAFLADVMILLTDGSILFHNGYVDNLSNASQWLRLTPDRNGNYETGTWSAQLEMQFARQWFASGILKDGRCFVIGGEFCSDPAHQSDAPSGEIFDPKANTWSAINKPPEFDFICGDCNGSVLSDGRVLLGAPNSDAFPLSKLTAIWEPINDKWIQAGLEFGSLPSTTKTDPFMEESFALLPDGSVLVPSVQNTPQAQRYVPSLDRWVDCDPSPSNLALTTLNGVSVMETGPIILLPTGSALVIGGTGQIAIFTPGPKPTDKGSWKRGPSCPKDKSDKPNWPTLTVLDSPGCLLPSGKVVFLAGNAVLTNNDYFSSNPVFLEYDPQSAATTVPSLDSQPQLPAKNQTWQSSFLLLPTGQLLCSAQTNTLSLYTPDAASLPNPAWKPAHISVPTTLTCGRSYTVSGTQINGLSQGVGYGDDGGMATNYPIVRLRNATTAQVIYLTSYDFSSMGVATGTRVPDDSQSCTIDIPSTVPIGSWKLAVVANGIQSDDIAVDVAAQR